VLTLLAAFALAVLWCVLRGPLAESRLAQVGFGLIAGGAAGNVIDRLVHGYVIDFVALPHFYVFNLADAAIACGLCLVALPSVVPPAGARAVR
jgi:lipoprotein signal peptidase